MTLSGGASTAVTVQCCTSCSELLISSESWQKFNLLNSHYHGV